MRTVVHNSQTSTFSSAFLTRISENYNTHTPPTKQTIATKRALRIKRVYILSFPVLLSERKRCLKFGHTDCLGAFLILQLVSSYTKIVFVRLPYLLTISSFLKQPRCIDLCAEMPDSTCEQFSWWNVRTNPWNILKCYPKHMHKGLSIIPVVASRTLMLSKIW